MNITRSNFSQTLPYVLECIRKSHFIAFDFEMTGISAHSLLRNSNLDSNSKLQLRYWKCKENTKRFLPIQMGLCPFEITNDKTVIARPFNFYIHPLPLEESIDRKFMCQASSMYFLSNYEFDFNKLFHDGIYYLSHEDAQVLENSKSIQKTKQKLREMSRVITPEMHTFSKLHLPKVEEFLDREDMPTMEIEIKFLKAKVYRHFETQVRNRWPHIPMTLTYDDESFLKRSKLIIKKVTQEELDAIKAAEAGESKSDEIEEDIDPIGFRKIIDEISALKLPLIVHNGFLDIQHLYDKFFSTLPETNKEFKINFKKEFPILYDTKYMHNNSNVLSGEVGSHMDLTSCYKSILKYHNHEPKVELGPEFQEYQLVGTDENSAASHEAGYDAMVTGYVFFKSLGILNLYNSLFDKTFAKRMKFYENRLPLGGIKVPFNLNYEDDIYKDSSLVFYIHNEQAVLTFEQIKAYFEENFGQANLYQIYGDRLEYFMIFQKHESGVKLKTWLDSKSGETNIQMNTDNGNALVGIKSFDKYEEKLKTKVRADLDQYEMPKVFDIIG